MLHISFFFEDDETNLRIHTHENDGEYILLVSYEVTPFSALTVSPFIRFATEITKASKEYLILASLFIFYAEITKVPLVAKTFLQRCPKRDFI